MPDNDYEQYTTDEIVDELRSEVYELRMCLDVLCPLVDELKARIQELEAWQSGEETTRMERNERCE